MTGRLDGVAKILQDRFDLRLAYARRTDGASVPTSDPKSPLPAKAAGNGAPAFFFRPHQEISPGIRRYMARQSDCFTIFCNRDVAGRHRRKLRELSAKSVHRDLQEDNFKGPR